MTLKTCVALTGLALSCLPQLATAQDTVILGSANTKNYHPFGITDIGTAWYIGEYQQVYGASAFSNPVLINQIAFSSYYSYSGTATYDLAVGLGITTKTPASPGTNFGTGFTTVFSGSLSPVFTATDYDFDFQIPLSTPFYYDPSQGNLLLDVTVFSASGQSSVAGFLFNADGIASNMGTLWSNGDSVMATPNWGLEHFHKSYSVVGV